MFLLDGSTEVIVTSPTDLTLASKCEFAFLRVLDVKLGRIAALDVVEDPMLKRTGALGDVHEKAELAKLRVEHGDGVVEIPRPRMSAAGLREAAAATCAALEAGSPVVFQATFFDESDPHAPTIGFADFLVRQADGRYRVQDTKLARSVKVTALLQLAAYHGHLVRLGIPTDDTVELILGDGTTSVHHIDAIAPVYQNRRARLQHLIREHLAEPGAVEWGDARYLIDGRCDHCEAEVVNSGDLLLVAGIRTSQRARLVEVGVTTLARLAQTPKRPDGCAVPERSYAALHAQAKLQHEAATGAPIPFALHAPQVIADLPTPDPGDIFFDFEGDPLHYEERGGAPLWGLDYLFGLVDVDEAFTPFWAHDLAAEKRALLDFLALVTERRTRYPGMHIYHYASYERTHLLSIAARHGVGEHVVDDLLRAGVLVDLYAVVKKALRVGVRSYSIKKLEPLYMGEELRSDDGVTSALGSVEEYVSSREALLEGRPGDAQVMLDKIADYNRYDCVSTHRLRAWLYEQAAASGFHPGTAQQHEELLRDPFEPDPLALQLLELAERADEAGGTRETYRLAAAAIDYHRRENKSFWWDHFARLDYPFEEWEATRGVFRVDEVAVEKDWHLEGRQRKQRRHLRLTGEWAPGSSAPRPGGDVFAIYEDQLPFLKPGRAVGSRLEVNVSFLDEPGGDSVVFIEEACPADVEPWSERPMALTPGPPPKADSLVAAIREYGARLVTSAPDRPADAATDILSRTPPASKSGALAAMDDPDDAVASVVASLLDLGTSYLAVQGPPGTGKTYVAARVVRELVQQHRWRIGVVAQSHRVVENVLDEVVLGGLDARLVAKAPASEAGVGYYAGSPFTELRADSHAAFAAEHRDHGYVVGGTAWDFTNLKRVDRDQLDLLVIEEAGQFSLANTIAVGVAAKRLLLLGDPQQLPQVSQGIHPAPVDGSALGHIGGGHDVLPHELGYFLAESRRMDAAVTAPVSRLAYEGALRSHETTRVRSLAGIEPGLHPVPVAHRDNSTSSEEEAARVVELARQHLGVPWTAPDHDRRASPLRERDIIVVTPYNAQVEAIRHGLDEAGLGDIRVGTVDKFQGQEAVISIVSLAASSPDDVPRGLSFLLSRNRLNVAISRAQWAAYLLFSPRLIEHLPNTPDGIAELSRFIELVGPRRE
jgi:uncharacterized protein